MTVLVCRIGGKRIDSLVVVVAVVVVAGVVVVVVFE